MKKTILITGGTGLIGKQMVSHYLKNNYIVITTTRNKSKIPNLIKELELQNYTQNLKVLVIDFLAKNCVQNFIEYLIQHKLSPEVIIHNARSLDTLKIDNDGFSSIENLLLEYKIGVAIPYKLTVKLLKSPSGTSLKNVIFISSIYGVVAPTPSLYKDSLQYSSPIQYGLTKAAQIHLTKELAVRLADDKIRVNTVSFGGIKGRTNKEFIKRYQNLNPQNRMLDQKEIIGPIDYLVSNKSLGMTGHNLIYDGGWTIW